MNIRWIRQCTRFIGIAGIGLLCFENSTALAESADAPAQNLKWIDAAQNETVQVNGLPWFLENGRRFIRMPLRERANLSEGVWRMSLCPSGARVRFKTDSTTLLIRVDHGMGDPKKLSMNHMSFVGVSGIDLYLGPPGRQDFWLTSMGKGIMPTDVYEYTYFEKWPKAMREFTLYLPAYSELKMLEIGIDADAALEPPTPYKISKPIVFYGTSITQSGCASRGSNGFVPLTGRMLNADIINLGFSGSAKCEEILANLIAQIDASAYVIDPVANMSSRGMRERFEPFVQILRQKKPDTPVILMTKIHYSLEILPEEAKEYENRHEPLFAAFEKRKQMGDSNIFLFDARQIIRPGGDHPSVDGIHLTDLGFKMIADPLATMLQKIIEPKQGLP